MSNRDSARLLIHTPADSAVEYVEYMRILRDTAGVKWGISQIDNDMRPMRPGDVIGIIARPGHGKSTIAAYLTRKVAKDIVREGIDNEIALYVTFEQSTEEIDTFFEIPDSEAYSLTDLSFGRIDERTLIKDSIKRISLPVFIMGESITRRKTMPRMTFDTIYSEIENIEEDYKVKPRIIVLDYIQIIPVDRKDDRVQQVGEAIVRSKELARRVGCPVVVCVQAGRGVDKYEAKVPTAADCQWASAIEQAADALIGIWRPALTEQVGSHKTINGKDIEVTQNLLIAKLLKQRMASAGHVWFLNFAPQYVRLSDMELNHADLNL